MFEARPVTCGISGVLMTLIASACLVACGGGSPTADAKETSQPDTTRAVTVAATPTSSGSTVVVRAKATLAGGVGANMLVRANGVTLGSATVGDPSFTGYRDYSFSSSESLGPGSRIDVAFTNDGVTEVNGVRTEDRNLIVESISVDGGTPLAANATGVTLDRGAGDAAFDGVDTLPGQSGLWWNAALRFVLPASTGGQHSVTVRASASMAGGVGAQMVLRVGGQVIGSTTVTNVGAMQPYTFALPSAPAAGTPIDVAFINDGVTVVNGVRTEDRNLYVESISVDGGTAIKSTDAGVTLDRGSGALAYDGLDVIPGQVALAWNGALRFQAPGTTNPPPLHTFTLRARATTLAGVGAAVTLRVGGQAIGSTMVNAVGTSQDYKFTTSLAIPPGTLADVVYTNDGASATEARDLYIESLTLDGGTPMLPTDFGVHFDKGEGEAAFDGVDLAPGQVILPWNGAMRFPIDNQLVAQSITVRAGGISAGGVAPQMQVWVNGGVMTNPATGTTEFTVQNASPQDYILTAKTRPGSRIDLVFVNPGSSTDATGTTQRTLVIESITAGQSAPIPATASGVVFDAGITHPNVELAPWRDGINVKPGMTQLTEAGALRFSLGRLATATATAGSPVAMMSMAQKLAATRMGYAAVAAVQAQRAGLLQFPEEAKARAPLIPLTATVPASNVLCPAGGIFEPTFNAALLAEGASLPVAGMLQVYWDHCTSSWATVTGTSASEFQYRPYNSYTPASTTTYYPAVASTVFKNSFRWTDSRTANGITGSTLPKLDLYLDGRVLTSSVATSSNAGRYMGGNEWFRFHDLLVTDGIHGTQARIHGHWLISSGASYSSTKGASSVAIPLGLQLDMLDGAIYDVTGVFRMAQSGASTGVWTLVDLTVSRNGVFVGHVSSFGSDVVLEVDGQRLPW